MSTNEHQPLTSGQRWTLVAAALCAAGAVLLAALPMDWIEEVFGVEPDGGNGLLEFRQSSCSPSPRWCSASASHRRAGGPTSPQPT